MRAAPATGAAPSAASTRAPVSSSPLQAADGDQFSHLLAGAAAPAAANRTAASAQAPAASNSASTSGSDAAAAPAASSAPTQVPAAPSAPTGAPVAASASTQTADSSAATIIAGSGAGANSGNATTTAANVTATATGAGTPASAPAAATPATPATPATTAAAAAPVVAASTAAQSAPSTADVPAADDVLPAAAPTTTTTTAATAGTGKSGASGSSKASGHRAAATDTAAQGAAQSTLQAMWLLAPVPPPVTGGAADNASQDASAGDSAPAGQSDSIAPVTGAASAATLATLAPSAASAFAPTAASTSGSASTAATTSVAAAVTDAGAAGAAGAATIAAASAVADSGLNFDSQPDANATANASGGDQSGAGNAVSSTDLSALAGLLRALPNAAVQGGSGAEHTIALPVSDQNWSHAVAAQVQLFAAANIQNATLRLSPEHLGPVEVHIDVQPSQINVSFVAAHAETRSALEQALPTLRALLANGGLTLGQANVQGESRSASQTFAVRAHGAFGAAPVEEVAAAGPARAVGLVDEYA